MELVLTDEEFYALYKSLMNCIRLYPELLGNREGLRDALKMLYMASPERCEFVITVREKKES